MASTEQHSGLDMMKDMEFQRKDWAMQRVGWAIMAAIVLAALLGLFGGIGPLSEASIQTEDGSLELDYLRFLHMLEPNHLTLKLQSAAGQRELRLVVNDDYIRHFSIESISPEPESIEASGRNLVYVFQIAQPEQPVEIVFYMNAIEATGLHGAIGLEAGPVLEFDQIVFP